MSEIRLARDEVRTCRDRAAEKTAAFVEGLKGKTDREKYNALHDRFNVIAGVTAHAAENFHPDIYVARENATKLEPGSLKNLLKTAVKGRFEMKNLLRAMKSLRDEEGAPLWQVNGTSAAFAACASQIAIEGMFGRVGTEFMISGKKPEGCPCREERPAIDLERLRCSALGAAAKISQIIATFLILPEAVSALC